MYRSGYYSYPPLTVQRFYNKEDRCDISVGVDEFGFRNTAGSLASSRIALLGDSFISAVNTPGEGTLAGLLAADSGAAVYNAGMDGFSTFHEYRLLRDLIAFSGIRTAIVAFYLGNDMRDNFLENDAEPAGKPARVPSQGLTVRIRNLFKNSALFNYLYVYVYTGFIRGHYASVMSSYALSEMESYRHEYQPDMNRAMEKTVSALRLIRDLAQRTGVSLVVVGIPSKAQVAQSFHEINHFFNDRRSAAHALEVIRAGYSFDRPDEVVKGICAEEGIEYVSLLGPFRSHGAAVIYYQLDSHWNRRGQRAAYEIIREYLHER